MSIEWAEFVSFWSNWTLIGALIVGVVATYGIVVSGNVKEAAANAKIARLTNDTVRLSAEAHTAEARISEANARAAEANERAISAQLELVKRTAPRTLGPDRQQEVSAAIRPFAGQRYRVAISQAADDGLAFWESLYATLKEAGWICIPMPPGQPSMGYPPAGIPIAAAPGIEIVFDPAKEIELSPAALALGNALHRDGTVVAVDRDNQSNPVEAERDILLIRIGARVPRQ